MHDQAVANLAEAGHPMADRIDSAALDALRPGMPAARLTDAFGSTWREPAPGMQGLVDALALNHGFTARLDVEGRIAMVVFGDGFPTGTPIGGVHLGATLAAVAGVRPDLEIHEASPHHPERRFAAVQSAEGVWFGVRFTDGIADQVTLVQAGAIFAAPLPPSYPEPSGARGAPFVDPALKLAVLSALLDAKAIDLGTPEQLAAHVLGRVVDLEEGDYGPIPKVRDWLERYPLDDALLARVTTLSLGGGNAVYPYIDGFWGGEDDQFDVATLAGIEHLPNLAAFHVTALIRTVDLRQLLGLPALRVIQIGVDVAHLDALLAMPALEAVSQMSDAAYAEATDGGPARAVYDSLKARGVQVWVYWTTHDGPDRPPAYE